jgi:hypothetical protein
MGRGIKENHGTQDSRVVPHRGTNWAALWLTSQIGRDAVLSESYGRGYQIVLGIPQVPILRHGNDHCGACHRKLELYGHISGAEHQAGIYSSFFARLHTFSICPSNIQVLK